MSASERLVAAWVEESGVIGEEVEQMAPLTGFRTRVKRWYLVKGQQMPLLKEAEPKPS